MHSSKFFALLPAARALHLIKESGIADISNVSFDSEPEADTTIVKTNMAIGTPAISIADIFNVDEDSHGYSEFHFHNSDVEASFNAAHTDYGTCTGNGGSIFSSTQDIDLDDFNMYFQLRLADPSTTLTAVDGDPLINCLKPIYQDKLQIDLPDGTVTIDDFKFAAMPVTLNEGGTTVEVAGYSSGYTDFLGVGRPDPGNEGALMTNF